MRERSSRTLDQRLALRFPRLLAASSRLIGKLPPRSRVRQAILWRTVRLAVEAHNRRDLDVVAAAYMPMRAQASGVPLAQTYAGVSTLKDGRVIRQHDFLNQAEALEAVGLAAPRTAAGSG